MSSKEEQDIRTSVDPKYATCIVSNVHFCTSVGVGGWGGWGCNVRRMWDFNQRGKLIGANRKHSAVIVKLVSTHSEKIP